MDCGIIVCMKCFGMLFGLLGISVAYAAPEGAMVRAAKSLLSVQSYPKTFDDLSFTNKMAVLAEGYEPWEGVYDAAGKCVSGCLYQGITIQDELRLAAQNTNQAVQELQQSGYLSEPATQVNVSIQGSVVPQENVTAWRPSVTYTSGDVLPGADVAQTEPSVSNAVVEHVQDIQPVCNPSQPDIKVGQTVPVGEPLIGQLRITSQFGQRKHPKKKYVTMHRGIDLAAPIGTNVFSAAQGRVVKVWTDSSCGNGLTIAHSQGYETQYCHLSQCLVRNGDVVHAGCLVAKTGNTGVSTGPHLHYAIKKNGEYIDPAPLMRR